MKAYPKKIFVKWEDGGNGSDYLNPATDIADHGEVGVTSAVGVYQLVETQTVKGVVITNTVRKTARK